VLKRFWFALASKRIPFNILNRLVYTLQLLSILRMPIRVVPPADRTVNLDQFMPNTQARFRLIHGLPKPGLVSFAVEGANVSNDIKRYALFTNNRVDKRAYRNQGIPPLVKVLLDFCFGGANALQDFPERLYCMAKEGMT